MEYFFIAVVAIIAVVVIRCVRVVPQSYAFVIERLGTYAGTWETGLHVLLPFIDRIAKKVSLKEQVADFPPQPVITKDNVTMEIDTVVFFQITDPKLFTYGVANPMSAIESLSATTLRNIIGDMELDNTLTSRDVINSKIRTILDEATDPWGIKVTRVELKNIMPPTAIQNAMEKQMKAERERREAILKAEGEKAARVLEAQSIKESQILEAEGQKEAAILNADAVKEAKIREAEGESQAMLALAKAQAESVRLINEASPSKEYLTMKSFETFEKVANGNATKIIVPSDIQNLAGTLSALGETVKPAKEKAAVKKS